MKCTESIVCYSFCLIFWSQTKQLMWVKVLEIARFFHFHRRFYYLIWMTWKKDPPIKNRSTWIFNRIRLYSVSIFNILLLWFSLFSKCVSFFTFVILLFAQTHTHTLWKGAGCCLVCCVRLVYFFLMLSPKPKQSRAHWTHVTSLCFVASFFLSSFSFKI